MTSPTSDAENMLALGTGDGFHGHIQNEAYPLEGSLSESRCVRVVLYDATPTESEHRFWISPQAKFGEVMTRLAEVYPLQEVVVLQAKWGARPYWVEADPDSQIGTTYQALYAILKDLAAPYILGVVRESTSDYPVPIFKLTRNPSATLSELVVSSSTKLTGKIKYINLYSGNQDLRGIPFGYEWCVRNTSQASPAVITTLHEPPKDFMVGSLYDCFSSSHPKVCMSSDSDGLIPPILQIPLVDCKLLIQRAYGLNAFSLQMIHLLSAILHVIISLARDLEPAFETNPGGGSGILQATALDEENDLADHLRVAPLLSRRLEGLLVGANGIMSNLKSGVFDRDEVQHAIGNMFDILCGDLPGAVTVRYSEADFKELRIADHKELDALTLHKSRSQNDERATNWDLRMDQVETERDTKTSIMEAHRSSSHGLSLHTSSLVPRRPIQPHINSTRELPAFSSAMDVDEKPDLQIPYHDLSNEVSFDDSKFPSEFDINEHWAVTKPGFTHPERAERNTDRHAISYPVYPRSGHPASLVPLPPNITDFPSRTPTENHWPYTLFLPILDSTSYDHRHQNPEVHDRPSGNTRDAQQQWQSMYQQNSDQGPGGPSMQSLQVQYFQPTRGTSRLSAASSYTPGRSAEMKSSQVSQEPVSEHGQSDLRVRESGLVSTDRFNDPPQDYHKNRPSSASPHPDPSQAEKPTPILIEPPQAELSRTNQWIVEALHPTLGHIVKSWSGETRESQENVLNKMIEELDKESVNIIRRFEEGFIKVDIEHLRRILNPLCGPDGKLCLVNRRRTQSGVTSILCNKCQKSFDANPIQAYAHHLITFHWDIKVFACYASNCNKRFAWTHDRDRHERSKHNLYRRKAYDLATKRDAEERARPKAKKEAPMVLTGRIVEGEDDGIEPWDNKTWSESYEDDEYEWPEPWNHEWTPV